MVEPGKERKEQVPVLSSYAHPRVHAYQVCREKFEEKKKYMHRPPG